MSSENIYRRKFFKIKIFIKASKHARSNEASLLISNIFLSTGNDEVLFQQRLRLIFAPQPSTMSTLNTGEGLQKGYNGHLCLLWASLGLPELTPGVPWQSWALGIFWGLSGRGMGWAGTGGLAVHCWPRQCLLIFLGWFPLSVLLFIQEALKIWANKSFKTYSGKPDAISGCNNFK